MIRWEHETVLEEAQARLDGLNALPDQNAGSGEYRDESARAGVQHEAHDEHDGYETAHRGDGGVESPFFTDQEAQKQAASVASEH